MHYNIRYSHEVKASTGPRLHTHLNHLFITLLDKPANTALLYFGNLKKQKQH